MGLKESCKYPLDYSEDTSPIYLRTSSFIILHSLQFLTFDAKLPCLQTSIEQNCLVPVYRKLQQRVFLGCFFQRLIQFFDLDNHQNFFRNAPFCVDDIGVDVLKSFWPTSTTSNFLFHFSTIKSLLSQNCCVHCIQFC